ncbi:hypothetical protein OH77DRAFT_1394962, partial [Trametes cingulata]
MPTGLAQLPARSDRSAPVFDPDKPRTLRRYFTDLDRLFNALENPLSEKEKKQAACDYPPIEVADIWEQQPEYQDDSKPYEVFKTAIINLYPGSDERRWTMADLQKLVEERRQKEIETLAEYAAYYRELVAAANYLKNDGWIGDAEIARYLYQGLPEGLRARVDQRLQIACSDHPLNKPYTLKQYDDSVRYLLNGAPSRSSALPVSSTPSATPAITAQPLPTITIKPEGVNAFAEAIATAVKAVI